MSTSELAVGAAQRERVFPEGPNDTSVPGVGAGGSTAIIVCHGMGQQLPFETLEGVGRLLRTGLAEAGVAVEAQTARHVVMGSEPMPRVELTLRQAGEAQPRTVHLYEAYWAPLTEGQVTLRDTVAFLWAAGSGGLRSFLSPRVFDRWMFGKPRDLTNQGLASSGTAKLLFTLARAALGVTALLLFVLLLVLASGALSGWQGILLPAVGIGLGVTALLALGTILAANPTTRNLLFAVAVFGALVAIDGLIAGSAAGSVLYHWTGWTRSIRLAVLSCDLLVLLLLAGGLAGLGIGGPTSRRKRLRAQGQPATLMPAERTAFRNCMWGALLTLCVMAGVMLWHGADPEAGRRFWEGKFAWNLVDQDPTAGSLVLRVWLVGGLWAVLGLASRKVRDLLVQFPGDVAAYVSSHQVNRFYELRRQIKETGRKVFNSVYGAVGEDAQSFRYDRVLVVAHSLGSVVAYDALNGVLAYDDTLNGRLQAVERTRLFLTFGSPLDKTAFLFRSQASAQSVDREALASGMQPLIMDERYRRDGMWVNVYSPDDWISGCLEFYDNPDWAEKDPRRVQNRVDPEACTPGLAHNEYWENGLLREILRDAVLK